MRQKLRSCAPVSAISGGSPGEAAHLEFSLLCCAVVVAVVVARKKKMGGEVPLGGVSHSARSPLCHIT